MSNKVSYLTPELSSQTSFLKQKLFTPDRIDELNTDDEDTIYQPLYSDHKFSFK